MLEFREDISRLLMQEWGNQMQLVREEIEEEYPSLSEIRIFNNGVLDRSLNLDPRFYCLFLDELEESLSGILHYSDYVHPFSMIKFSEKDIVYSLLFYEGRCISRCFHFVYQSSPSLALWYSKGCKDKPNRSIDVRSSSTQAVVNALLPRETLIDISRIEKEFPYICREEIRNGQIELVFSIS